MCAKLKYSAKYVNFTIQNNISNPYKRSAKCIVRRPDEVTVHPLPQDQPDTRFVGAQIDSPQHQKVMSLKNPHDGLPFEDISKMVAIEIYEITACAIALVKIQVGSRFWYPYLYFWV